MHCCQTLGLVLRLRVDFVLPLSQEQQEQEQPPPNFYQTERPYVFGRCLEGVPYVSGRYQDCVWFLDGVWKMSGRCLEGILRVLVDISRNIG